MSEINRNDKLDATTCAYVAWKKERSKYMDRFAVIDKLKMIAAREGLKLYIGVSNSRDHIIDATFFTSDNVHSTNVYIDLHDFNGNYDAIHDWIIDFVSNNKLNEVDAGKIMLNSIYGAKPHNYYLKDMDINSLYPRTAMVKKYTLPWRWRKIKKVIFNNPATIVFWADDTKTVVKAQEGDKFDPEKGLAMAIAKKTLGNEGNYYNEIYKWICEYYKNLGEVKMIDSNRLTETANRAIEALKNISNELSKF